MPRALIDPKDHPFDRVLYGRSDIEKVNPQRFEFSQIDGILHYDPRENLIVASRRVLEDEFWIRGHIPGRPLFPGVLQAECMAQAGGFHTAHQLRLGTDRFVGFGGIEKMRFRVSIEPGAQLWVAGRLDGGSATRGMFKWSGQIINEAGRVAAEGTILGVVLGDAPSG